MPIEIPFGGGTGARVPVQFRTFNYNTLALLQADASANPSELLNNSAQFSIARVTADPTTANNGSYEYRGSNGTYEADGWVLADELSGSDRAAINSIKGLNDNTIPIASGGSLTNSNAVRNPSTGVIESADPWKLPGGGALEFDNNDMSSGGTVSGGAAGVRFTNNSDDTEGYLISVPFVTATGSGRPFYDKFGAEIVAPSAADKSDPRTARFDFINPLPGIVTEYTVSRPANSPTLNDCNFTIWLEGYNTGVPLFDYKESNPGGGGFTLVAGENTVTPPVPIGFPANINPNAPANEQVRLYSEVVDADGNLVTLDGQVITIPAAPDPRAEQQWLPFLGRKVHFSVKTEVPDLGDIRSDTDIYNKVKSTLVAGNGFTIVADDTAETLTLAPTGQSSPSIHDFSINIPATVNLNTDLNNARTVRYSTTGTSEFTALNLVVETGDNKMLTLPTLDGSHNQEVTLSGISTATAGTLTFYVQGTTSGGTTIRSNSQVVTIRAQLPQDLAYYGVRTTNDFTTVALTELTSVDVAPPGTRFDIRETVANSSFLGILMPSDRDLTNIQELTFNVPATSNFTRQANARMIGGKQYHLYTLQNNSGFSGSFNYRVDT